MIVGYGHASESLAYLLIGASMLGSSANVASEQPRALIGGGPGGTRPPTFQDEGDSIGIVPPPTF